MARGGQRGGQAGGGGGERRTVPSEDHAASGRGIARDGVKASTTWYALPRAKRRVMSWLSIGCAASSVSKPSGHSIGSGSASPSPSASASPSASPSGSGSVSVTESTWIADSDTES